MCLGLFLAPLLAIAYMQIYILYKFAYLYVLGMENYPQKRSRSLKPQIVEFTYDGADDAKTSGVVL